MHASKSPHPEGGKFDGATDVLRCPRCGERWVSFAEDREQVECPECDRGMVAAAGRLCEIGEGGGITRVVEIEVPPRVVALAAVLEDEYGADLAEVLRRSVVVDLDFVWESEA